MRIVSLLPSATEICFALGLGEQVVGVTHECDYPAAARALPRLTSSMLPASALGDPAAIDRHVRASVHSGSSLYALDSALLESLAPDLIVTQELCAVCAVSYEIVATAAKRLRGDPRVVSLEPTSFDDVLATIRFVAGLAGVPARGDAVASNLLARADALRTRTARLPRPKVLVLEWTDPPMSGGHWTPGLVELAGGTPLLAHPNANSQTLAWEEIAASDPDVVLVSPCGFPLSEARDALGGLAANPAWKALRAIREGRVWAIDGNAYVNRPGPRLVETAEIFAYALHGLPSDVSRDPEAFAGPLA